MTEIGGCMVKLLIIGDINYKSTFTFEYLTEVISGIQNIEVAVCATQPAQNTNSEITDYVRDHDIKVFYPPERKNVRFPNLPHINLYIESILHLRVCRQYDIVHVLGVDSASVAVALFSKRDCRIIVSYKGSDLLRTGKIELALQKPLLKRANVITMATDFLVKKFHEKHGNEYNNKIVINGYGTKNADAVIAGLQSFNRDSCKKVFRIPTNKFSILCGYNGSPAHRHIEIIKMLSALGKPTKNKLYIVCHCAYALSDKYRLEIEEGIKESGIEGRLISDFFVGEKMAKFRMSTDIMLNLQPTDALSASMLECLEAGAVVIKGDWLVYPVLDERNAFILSVEEISEIPLLITNIVNNIEEYREKTKANRGLLYDILSWEPKKEIWRKIITDK